MAEDKATVKKVESTEQAQPAAAEVTTAPVQSVAEEPVKELRATGNPEDDQKSSDDYTKDELQQMARERSLEDTGTKSELFDRINEHDELGVHKPEVLYPDESE